MSTFKITARHKRSGELHEIWCIDDFYGRRNYGYVVNIPNGPSMTEDNFYEEYEPEEEPTHAK